MWLPPGAEKANAEQRSSVVKSCAGISCKPQLPPLDVKSVIVISRVSSLHLGALGAG